MYNDDQPLLISDVARALKLAEPSVRRLEAAGVLRAMRTPGGIRIFRRADVERVASERAARRAGSVQLTGTCD
jgi:DNA-binding transcriptional MerR regulator